MKYLKKFETFDSALYDILSSGDNREEELKKLLSEVEDENSEDGEEWSDSERKKIDAKLRQLAPDLVDKPDSVSDETKMRNSLHASISNAKTTISMVKRAMSDDKYSPKNPAAASKLKSQIKDLKSAIDSEKIDKINLLNDLLSKTLRDSDYQYK
jgi:ribosomal protein S20